MADKKITQFDEITDPANEDVLLLVDVTGPTTKKVLRSNLLPTRYIQVPVVEWTADTFVGNGQWYLHVPPDLNGLFYSHRHSIQLGT